MVPITLLMLMTLRPGEVRALERQVTISTRLEQLSSREDSMATRALSRARVRLSSDDLSLTVDAFGEADAATAAEKRRTGAGIELQEAYVDYRLGSFFLRAGRQPVRWSQSWTVPSLDLFTGRGWNRLFFDPVPEQLIHPDGVLLTWAGADASLDVFSALVPAIDRFPEPLPEAPKREFDPEYGLRFQYKFSGFDSMFVYKWADEVGTFGMGLNYAFQYCVLKTELGVNENHDGFATVGTDVFIGDFTALPQVTLYSDKNLTAGREEHSGYLPLRYAWDKNAFEFQIYYNFDTRDTFTQVMYSRDWNDDVKISVFAQKYEGMNGRLFELYENLTAGAVGGIRLEISQAL